LIYYSILKILGVFSIDLVEKGKTAAEIYIKTEDSYRKPFLYYFN